MAIEAYAAIVFFIFISVLFSVNRKKLDTKFIVPKLVYFSMYRTTWGLKLMDSLANRFRIFFKWVGYTGIVVGFLGMLLMAVLLIANLVPLIKEPGGQQGVGVVLPVKAKGIFYVPFFYWVISIFVIAAVHEFAHGLIARVHNMKVKSSGFAFLGIIIPIIPAAFVEPDEKELKKRPYSQQLSVFAAGAFSNIVFSVIFLGLVLAFSSFGNNHIEATGIKITGYAEGNQTYGIESANVGIGETIIQIDNQKVSSQQNLSNYLRTKKPGDTINLMTEENKYTILLHPNPDNESMAFMGAILEERAKFRIDVSENTNRILIGAYLWIFGLLYWLAALNFGIGIFNLLPVGPIDGGRMFQLASFKIFGKEKGSRVWVYIGIFFLVIVLVFIGHSMFSLVSDLGGRIINLIR